MTLLSCAIRQESRFSRPLPSFAGGESERAKHPALSPGALPSAPTSFGTPPALPPPPGDLPPSPPDASQKKFAAGFHGNQRNTRMNRSAFLDDVLARWQPDPPSPDPSFAAEVWQRIHSAPTRRASIIPFPLALPLAAGLAVLLGVGSALHVNTRHARDAGAAAYARSIDPLQMADSRAHPHEHPHP